MAPGASVARSICGGIELFVQRVGRLGTHLGCLKGPPSNFLSRRSSKGQTGPYGAFGMKR